MSKSTGWNCSTGICTSKNMCYTYESELLDLVIQIDGINYSVPPSGYLLDVSNNNNASCILMVSALADSYGLVLLGDTFIRNFYTVFNYSVPYSVSLA